MLFDKSFSILRANPALTTNVRIVVTSAQKLYLESFPASLELTAQRFYHYELKPDSYLFEEIPLFWTQIEAQLAFASKNLNDFAIMYDDYQYQYDDIYFSGASATADTFYNEEYEYNTTLWINKDKMPVAFIILRVDGPGLNDGNSPFNFRSDILNTWKFVTFFDLTTENNFGAYVNQQTSHPFYPKVPLEINHEEIASSVFNGIDYNITGYAKKYVDFDPIKSLNTRIFQLEENITNRWRDLGLIFPNILNIKFLFDDTPATPSTLRPWSINRFVGFYIDQIDIINSVSPYKPFDLKKTPNEQLESLTPAQVAELPYILNNTIVQDIGGRTYNFDPIAGDWKDSQQYWVEWQGKYYRLSKETNTNSSIIGAFVYKIISDVNITYTAPSTVTNPTLIQQYQKVLLNELDTLKYQIQIISNLVFENITGQNIIQNVNSTYTTLNRLFQQYLVGGQLVWGFKIQLVSELNNNLFTIPNYADADLFYIDIDNKKHVIKQYPIDIPNIGGLFYIQSDYAVNIDSRLSEQWINNGNVSKDPAYYIAQDIQNIAVNNTPIFYNIYRAAFTDVKDFDFDRVETASARYEYENNNTVADTLEPKLYTYEKRTTSSYMLMPQEINTANFTNQLFLQWLNSDPLTYQQWLQPQNIKRSPVGSEVGPQQVYFDTFDKYANFKYTNIIAGTTYYVNDVAFTENLNTYKARLPLYIYPTRQAILDINNNPFVDPDTGETLWQTDINGDYIYTSSSSLKKVPIPLNREYYREEGYILLQNDQAPETVVDFLATSEPTVVQPKLTWTKNIPMATTMVWSPYRQSVDDPNEQVDSNYIPVTSEYIASEELWEVRNQTDLSPIWSKNQYICKWGLMNSLSTHDYSYRLNYDLEVGGLYNNEPSVYNTLNFPLRKFRDLDYFYRFGIDTNFQNLHYYTQHLKEPFFDYDKYLLGGFDYFDWVFHSDLLTAEGIKVYKKYSVLDFGDDNEGSYTVFKGIKWRLYDVSSVVFNANYTAAGKSFVEDYVTVKSNKYNGYKFSIAMGRKLSSFQNLAGDNDGDFGIDIIVNDQFKNVLIFLYFDSDQIVTFGQKLSDNTVVQTNIETAQLDLLYAADQISSESIDPTTWQNGQLKINGTQNIGDIRIRNLSLTEVISIINNHNYNPVNGSGRQPVNYVRINVDGTIKIMNSKNTDFTIEPELPVEFQNKEKTFRSSNIQPSGLTINNSLKNVIVLNDTSDPNATRNTSGALINTVLNINMWDGQPVGRTFTEGDPNDTRLYYNLDPNTDPTIYRHSGVYAPIFVDLNLFRPTSYWTLTNNNTTFVKPALSPLNWKFYDDFSDGQSNGPSVFGWGFLNEIIFSKVNKQGNILKLALNGDTKEKSIYPMVDEFGYNYSPRYIFQSTWDRNFYLESRSIVLNINKYPGNSGYCIFLDGISDVLKINDDIKFNLLTNGYNIQAQILPSDKVTLPSGTATEITISNIDPTKPTYFYLTNTVTSQKSVLYFFTPNNPNAGLTNIVPDNFITTVLFSPDSFNPTSIRIRSTSLLSYQIYTDPSTPTNVNGHVYLLNREINENVTVFASAQLTMEPINGEISFVMNTNTRGTINYDYFIPSNIDRQTFINQFKIADFINNSNSFLSPDYEMVNVSGDVKNLVVTIKAKVAGPTYNFTITNLKNAVENTVQHVNAPAQSNYVEKSASALLQYVGQNNTMTAFTNKCIYSFTVEFWIKCDGFTKDFETIMYKGSTDIINDKELTTHYSWIIRRHQDTSKIEFVTNSYIVPNGFDPTTIVPWLPETQIGNQIFENTLASNSDIDDGTWHYCAFIFDASTHTKYIYIDQNLDAQVENENFNNIVIDPDPNIGDKNWPILIGSDYQNGVLNFRGSIDELRIWNYARSQQQILNNYNLQLEPTSYLDPSESLVAYYRFNEKAGVLEIVDYSEAIFELERIEVVSENTTNNGTQTIIEDDTKFYQNENSFHNKTPILVTNVVIEWVISGAEIKGISDERYTVPLPVSSVTTKLTQLPTVITPRSKYAGQFVPSIAPVPRPTPPTPAVPPVKVVALPPKLVSVPRPVIAKKVFPKFHFIRFKPFWAHTYLFNKLDYYDERIQYITARGEVDDILNLQQRQEIFNDSPFEFLNNTSTLSNNVQEKQVTFSQNKPTGVTAQYNGLLYSPTKNLPRRAL